MTYSDLCAVARAKAGRASTVAECDAAIMDCHDTLQVGRYEHGTPYATKIWAEIDAYRDRKWALERAPRIANDFGNNEYI